MPQKNDIKRKMALKPDIIPNNGDGQEEMVSTAPLLTKLERIKNKDRMLNTEGLMKEQKLKKLKIELLKSFYAVLQESGVDPSDMNSISSFMQKLEERDPDLVTLFERLFEVLDPDGSAEIKTSDIGATDGVAEGVGVEPSIKNRMGNEFDSARQRIFG